MSRHRDGGPDVRLKLGAMVLAIALLFGALCASGIAMVTGFRGAETPRPPTPPRLGNAAPAVQYTGPLPTGMVGLVTIGADPTGTRPPIASPVDVVSSSVVSPSSAVPSRSPITVVVAAPRTTSAAPTSTLATSVAPTSSAPSTVTFPWPTPSYSWPGKRKG